MHCHHEKTIVIDDRVAFVGGIDLTSEDGDRFDTARTIPRGRRSAGTTSAHRIEGPAVADVAEHFRMRWHEVTGERLARRRAAADRPATSSCRSSGRCRRRSTRPSRSGDFGILESYVRAFRGAERFIYLENQFLWSPEIASVLAEKLAQPTDARTSGSSSSCPRSRTTAPTTPAASSASCSRPTPATGGSSPARSTPAPGLAPIRSTSTRRSGSSTTAG